jgi:hypothetical protein
VAADLGRSGQQKMCVVCRVWFVFLEGPKCYLPRAGKGVTHSPSWHTTLPPPPYRERLSYNGWDRPTTTNRHGPTKHRQAATRAQENEGTKGQQTTPERGGKKGVKRKRGSSGRGKTGKDGEPHGSAHALLCDPACADA